MTDRSDTRGGHESISEQREAVLLASHFAAPPVLELFDEISRECPQRDVYLLFDVSSEEPPGELSPDKIHTFSKATVWSELGVPRPRGRFTKMFPGNTIVAPLHFASRYPDYSKYWLVENDVRFTGPWNRLFDHFAGSPADLLATTIIRYPQRAHWRQWRGVRRAGVSLPREELLGAFLPCHRLSPAAVEVLIEAYREPWEGHSECFVPTALSAAGLGIEDIGGSGDFVAEGNQNKFYWNTLEDAQLAPGSFVFRPVRRQAGDRQMTLWHPVKPERVPGPWETHSGHLAQRLRSVGKGLLQKVRRTLSG